MPEIRHVTLSKAHRETPTGRELIALLTELSADGNVSREEMERLRARLEVDRGVDFPALSFLYETIDQSQWTVRSRKTSWTIWPSPLSGCFPRTFDLLRRPSGKKHVRPGA